ncbi:MAG: hypothetical protein IJR60_02565 [Eubacterium sp.]|nr:hypothetical protein [Eubacterium sp.]
MQQGRCPCFFTAEKSSQQDLEGKGEMIITNPCSAFLDIAEVTGLDDVLNIV